tara:strand:- start:5579 stop:5920 length:342 start_codon:yes stop_codon:yes gene_type:complete
MFGLGGGELLLLGIIALVFIGPKKLPELARGLGKGIREFQKAKNELLNEEDNDDLVEHDKSSSSASNSSEIRSSEDPVESVSDSTGEKEEEESNKVKKEDIEVSVSSEQTKNS